MSSWSGYQSTWIAAPPIHNSLKFCLKENSYLCMIYIHIMCCVKINLDSICQHVCGCMAGSVFTMQGDRLKEGHCILFFCHSHSHKAPVTMTMTEKEDTNTVLQTPEQLKLVCMCIQWRSRLKKVHKNVSQKHNDNTYLSIVTLNRRTVLDVKLQ